MSGDKTPFSHRIDVRSLESGRASSFEVIPDAAILKRIAEDLGLSALRKTRLTGTLVPEGRQDWRLDAALGATVVQPCIITGAPVTTRIDVPVQRLYVSGWQDHDGAGEFEFDGDDEVEPLESAIDLGQVLVEALALELPEYPRADGAELAESSVSPPGAAPIGDDEVKPFAALAQLKDKMKN